MDAQNGLNVHRHITQLCVKKNAARIQRCWMYSLFHLNLLNSITQFFSRMTVVVQTSVFKYPHRKSQQGSNQVSMQAR